MKRERRRKDIGKEWGKDKDKDREGGGVPPRRGEDWRLGVMWGRTLVGVASELVIHSSRSSGSDGLPPNPNPNPKP